MNKEKTYQSWYVFIYYSVTLGVSVSDTVIVLATVSDAPLYVIVYLRVYVPAFVNVYVSFCALPLVPSSGHETVILAFFVMSTPSFDTDVIPGSVYKTFTFAVSFKLPARTYVSKLVVFSGYPLTSIVIPELCVTLRLLKVVFTIYVTFLFCLVALNVVFVVNPSELVTPVELSLTNTS